MKYARTLLLDEDERPEPRAAAVLKYILENYEFSRFELRDLDATGKLGNELTHILNEHSAIYITSDQTMTLLEEDGQVFDMDLLLLGDKNFRVIIVRGDIVDLVGEAELPTEIVGNHVSNDISNY